MEWLPCPPRCLRDINSRNFIERSTKVLTSGPDPIEAYIIKKDPPDLKVRPAAGEHYEKCIVFRNRKCIRQPVLLPVSVAAMYAYNVPNRITISFKK